MNVKKGGKLAIALSGGSVRSLAHIGFLEVLEENHVPIDVIVGTSGGAMVGGLYAAGKLKEFKEKILKLSDNRVLTMLLSNKLRKGNTDSKEIEKILSQFIEGKKISSLNIEFAAIATNLKTGSEVCLDKGDLIKAITASIAIPGVFKPVKYGKMILSDGGILDPLPEEQASLRAKKVISVNAMPSQYSLKKDADYRDILSEAVGIMTFKLITLKRKKNKNVLFVQLKTRGIDSFDFRNIKKVIKIGRKAAKKNLKKILEISKS